MGRWVRRRRFRSSLVASYPSITGIWQSCHGASQGGEGRPNLLLPGPTSPKHLLGSSWFYPRSLQAVWQPWGKGDREKRADDKGQPAGKEKSRTLKAFGGLPEQTGGHQGPLEYSNMATGALPELRQWWCPSLASGSPGVDTHRRRDGQQTGISLDSPAAPSLLPDATLQGSLASGSPRGEKRRRTKERVGKKRGGRDSPLVCCNTACFWQQPACIP